MAWRRRKILMNNYTKWFCRFYRFYELSGILSCFQNVWKWLKKIQFTKAILCTNAWFLQTFAFSLGNEMSSQCNVTLSAILFPKQKAWKIKSPKDKGNPRKLFSWKMFQSESDRRVNAGDSSAPLGAVQWRKIPKKPISIWFVVTFVPFPPFPPFPLRLIPG